MAKMYTAQASTAAQNKGIEIIVDTLSPQYASAKNGEPIEGIRLPAQQTVVTAERAQDMGNTATYKALAQDIQTRYPGAFTASMSTDKGNSRYTFSITDISASDRKAVELEMKVKRESGSKTYETKLRTREGEDAAESQDARNEEADTRLLRTLRKFLEG